MNKITYIKINRKPDLELTRTTGLSKVRLWLSENTIAIRSNEPFEVSEYQPIHLDTKDMSSVGEFIEYILNSDNNNKFKVWKKDIKDYYDKEAEKILLEDW